MIGDNIKNLREHKNYKLSQLAKECGISAGYLSDIEKNIKKNPTLDVLNKISEVLGVPLNELLSTEEKLNLMTASMKKINKMAKDASNYSDMVKESNTSYFPTHENFFTKNFQNEVFSREEQTEIINYAKYIISKRKK